MARNETVWGIDIGNTSLKALRCRLGADPQTVEIIGFDYIEHSKIMSQPGADPAAILAESLELFMSRNNVKGEKIAISVSGQNTLWRFQPLPPIDPKKVTDLIKYEVKQWLPFDLQEVIWDYRQVGGIFEGNIALDLNIFMYAMKREVAIKTLDNYTRAGIDVDCIQGAQIALYNAFLYDHYNYEELSAQPLDELNDFDVILNVGTDTTEVIITNGVSVWLRNIPIGGNLFTKSLTKQLKLTFANAEHIKRNAASSQDPKAVILAMKPVFNDMLSEIDRSIKYYASLNKRAKFRKIYAFGNAMKLPGLRQFLAKSHGIDVEVLSGFKSMRGAEVLSNPQFKDNISSFGVAYGLVLQMLHQVPLDINLIPKEILTDRLVNSKKPWTLAAAALILLGFSIQYVASTTAFSVVENPAINKAYEGAKQVTSQSQGLISGAATEVGNFKAVDQIGRNLTSNVEGRLTWLELLKAVNTVIPAEAASKEILKEGASAIKLEAIEKQNRIYIKNIEVQALDDLAPWYEIAKQWYYIDDIEAAVFKKKSKITPEQYWFFPPASATKGEAGGQGVDVAVPPTAAGGAADEGAADGAAEEPEEAPAEVPAPGGALNQIVESRDVRIDKIPGPTGPGRIVQLSGYHYHNSDNVEDAARGPEYVRRTILRNLKHGSVELPVSLERQRGGNTGTEVVTLKQLGIYYPILMNPGVIDEKYRLLDPEAAAKERKKLMEKMLKSRPGGARYAGRGGGMMDDSMSMTGGGRGMPGLETIAGGLGRDQVLNLRRFPFVIQFVWQETPPSIRDLRNAAVAAAIAAAKGSAPEGSENPADANNPDNTAPAENNSPAAESGMGENENAPAPAPETPAPAGSA
ncbi:MAG: pilus assembly protein PilM, partial [Planctomycetia bacterium]|nr:pilus assembly protein PilM [Planctomycetia bacterium]